MSFETLKTLEIFLLPPGLLLILALLGIIISRTKIGRRLLFLSIVSLYLLSTPYVSSRLIMPLEDRYAAVTPQSLTAESVQALVLMGGGYYGESVEYADTAIGPFFAERLRYTAWLARQSNLPVIISSGKSDAHAAARILQQQYGVTPIAVEDKSWNTRDNADNTAALMNTMGIKRVAVITHGWHMPRAIWSFEQAGVDAVAAPMGLIKSQPELKKPKSWYPYSISLFRSDKAIHEHAGLFWYKNQEEKKNAQEPEELP